MNYYTRFCFVLLLGFSATVGAEPVADGSNYWQCTTYDATNKQWLARSTYEKIAINVAFAACKKESTAPATCSATKNNCEQIVLGFSIKPMWVCTALDRMAQPWRSNLYSQRLDAALAARAYCRQNSAVPETCYINLVTCVNRNS